MKISSPSAARLGALLAAVLGLVAARAAPLPPEIGPALEAARRYNEGDSRKALAILDRAVPRAAADPEQRRELAARLAAAVGGLGTTEDARAVLARHLALVAGDAEVPLLGGWLSDPERSDLARMILQPMEGPAASRALLAALGRARGAELEGVIQTLGERREKDAVLALGKLAEGTDTSIAAAAVRALGAIGSPEAARVLEKTRGPGADAAQLLCAQRLLADGQGPSALRLLQGLVAAPSGPSRRIAALGLLAQADFAAAMPRLTEALRDSDPFVAAGALRLLAERPGAGVTLLLAGELAAAPPAQQTLILQTLAGRADPRARDAILSSLASPAPAVRAAAASALGACGRVEDVALLAGLAAREPAPVRAAAVEAIGRLTAEGTDAAILRGVRAGEPAARVALIEAAERRRSDGLASALAEGMLDGSETVQIAAFEALGRLRDPMSYRLIVKALIRDLPPSARTAAERAAVATGRRTADEAARTAPPAELLADPALAPDRAASLLRVLAGVGGAPALAAVRAQTKAGDPALRELAARALADWPDPAAAPDLLALARDATNAALRTVALRGLLRLAPESAEPMKWIGEARPLATTAPDRRLILSALSGLQKPEALTLAADMAGEPEVAAEAVAAAVKIGQALVKSHPQPVAAAMARIEPAIKDPAVAKQAAALRVEAGGFAEARAAARAARAARLEALAKGEAPGARVLAYLDCGTDTEDAGPNGVKLAVVRGAPWIWPGATEAADAASATVAFDGQEVVLEAAGLKPDRAYRLGFTAWDFDGNGRKQSVWAGGRQMLAAAALPAWQGAKRGPATFAVPLPVAASGRTRVSVRTEGGGNAVVCEAWLIDLGPAVPGTSAPAPAAPASPAVRANAGAEKKVLIVTGLDYPGHKWRETTPALAQALAADTRLEVSVVEDAAFLAAPELKKYHAIVLHYMNWENSGPGPKAQENLRAAVEGGAGLVLVHFACGAFQGWPEFVKLAGRAWNPKLRGHDPHGAFTVSFGPEAHPVTEGMKPFETTDELYTCLDGDTPIRVLATAESKVDGKDYPMAFVLDVGKGRVFHCVLGHDAKAFAAEGAQTLYRRGTAWAAGLKPER